MFALGVALPAGTASAAPPTGLRAAAPDSDEEGGTPALRAQLEAASKGYLDAKRALDTSVQRQKQLATQLKTIEVELEPAQRQGRRDRRRRVPHRPARRDVGAAQQQHARKASWTGRPRWTRWPPTRTGCCATCSNSKDKANRTRVALDGEITEQRKQVAVMAKRKEQAERALTVATTPKPQTTADTGSNRGTSSANAKAAPRNSDGSWPSESCSVNDPTPASGCITPRTLHALNQAKAAGFTRYVSCHRPSGSGEHPKGRACDFAAQKGGFGGDATGGDKTYGNNLAAYFIRNADRLAVLYVIWYRQIWLPSSGWKSYSGAGGDPSSDHTNHVHLSVY